MATKKNISIDVTGSFCGKCIDEATRLKNDRYALPLYNIKSKGIGGRNTCQDWGPEYYLTDSEDEAGHDNINANVNADNQNPNAADNQNADNQNLNVADNQNANAANNQNINPNEAEQPIWRPFL